METDPAKPILQSAFSDFKICGKLTGKNFLSSTRVSKDSLECPSGTKPCTTATSYENTICIDESEDLSTCPITAMKAVQATARDKYLKDEFYTLVDFEIQGRYIVYSRTKTDMLPIGQIRLEHEPCMNPSDISTNSEAYER